MEMQESGIIKALPLMAEIKTVSITIQLLGKYRSLSITQGREIIIWR